jgi:hypothetical protein
VDVAEHDGHIETQTPDERHGEDARREHRAAGGELALAQEAHEPHEGESEC